MTDFFAYNHDLMMQAAALPADGRKHPLTDPLLDFEGAHFPADTFGEERVIVWLDPLGSNDPASSYHRYNDLVAVAFIKHDPVLFFDTHVETANHQLAYYAKEGQTC